jgi:hypothetical protein
MPGKPKKAATPVDCCKERFGAQDATRFARSRSTRYVCHHFGRTEAHNYYDVPRGRVLLNRKTGRGLIYHGNATRRAVLRRIAKLYGLSKWDDHTDGHYLMGAAADELFDNEFE